jgi:hypothetical protein
MDMRQWPTASDLDDLWITCPEVARYYEDHQRLREMVTADLSELRDEAIAEPIIVTPPWALAQKPPPPVPRGQRMSRIVIQRAVKARSGWWESGIL